MSYFVDAAIVLAAAAVFVVTLLAFRRAPAVVPTGYDFRSGLPSRWGARRMLWTTPVVVLMVGIIALSLITTPDGAHVLSRGLLLIVVAGYSAAMSWVTVDIARKQRDRLPAVLNPAAWIIGVILLGALFVKGI